jgi:hypothetical protein
MGELMRLRTELFMYGRAYATTHRASFHFFVWDSLCDYAPRSVPLWGDDLFVIRLRLGAIESSFFSLWGDDIFVLRLRLGAIVGR